ncbi:ATP-grasp domain-containing protein [Streptomyces buecherae]|uniref:ATP-grasp domain-containing protein n=1 Tax=Streptomyces buecherae TaxID=2763006 RepID=UPI001C25A2A3|nr:ATP-grasp domain-containing protein [Streptomyces buecherae]
MTYLHCPLYDFTATPAQRKEAIRLADHAAPFADPLDGDAVYGALLASGADPGDVDAVLSTLSYGAQAAADLAARIGARGTSPAGTLAARDKGECRRILRAREVPSVGFRVVTDAAEALEAAETIGYPVIVKPVLGIGKAVTSIAHDPSAVRAHFAAAATDRDGLAEGMARQLDERYLVEELVPGDLYSVEVAASGGRLVPLVCASRKVSQENPVLELGCTVPSGLSTADEAALGRYAVEVCRALGLDLGIFHVEVMHTPSGFRLIEVNPRLTGGSLPDTISAVAGVDIFALLVDLFLGRPLPDDPLPLEGSASHSFLAASQKPTVPAHLPDDWVTPFLGRLHSGYARVRAGDVVPPMRTNFDSFGMLRALAPTPAEAEAACSAVKADIEGLFGFPFLAEQTRTPIPAT